MGSQFRCFPLTSRCSPARTLVGATWVALAVSISVLRLSGINPKVTGGSH